MIFVAFIDFDIRPSYFEDTGGTHKSIQTLRHTTPILYTTIYIIINPLDDGNGWRACYVNVIAYFTSQIDTKASAPIQSTFSHKVRLYICLYLMLLDFYESFQPYVTILNSRSLSLKDR